MIAGRTHASSFISFAAWIASASIVLVAVWALSASLASSAVSRSANLNVAVVATIAAAICIPLAASRYSVFRPWRRDLAVAVGVASIGLALLACLRAWQAPYPLRDVIATFAVSLPFTVLVAVAYIRHRSLITTALSFGSPATSMRRRMAATWPWLVVALVILAFAYMQMALMLGRPTRGGPLLLSLLLVLAAPHIDVVIERRGRSAARVPGSEIAGALWRTLRVVAAAAIVATLAGLWLAPVVGLIGIPRGVILIKAAEILLLVAIIAFCWSWVAILATRIRPAPVDDPEGGGAIVGTRLTTVGPLLVGAAKAALLTLGGLTVLVMLGVNVWPLITGLSIFGLAIGLGSQTLVKDVVAGLFFLVDDAFRQGEYIESSGAKGTVEKISLRSVSLRHPRGAVATIPYGQIGKIQNFSRDWVIEKLLFRVPLDTDVELVRKLFKKVGQEIAADPELNADLMEPFKCQGIAALEEGTLVIRGKFKARAGYQFQIRKAVLSKVRGIFQENGIKLVPKPLQVPQMNA
ncbi:mechanosensitive ion channel family protein [Bosea sp. TAF32]|uniref:mechanosensitive ion channel family protein n=1 Tax=Bosea sp. TAF32 TaxID=3237482 RepID=UPI003F90ADDC